MVTHIKDEWLLPWREIARLSNVRLDVAKSYSDLVDIIIPCSGRVVVVVYINGSFRFSPSSCGTNPEIEKSRRAAVKFWDWCTTHAVNEPTNFLYTSVVEPCACSTWNERKTVCLHRILKYEKIKLKNIQFYENDLSAFLKLQPALIPNFNFNRLLNFQLQPAFFKKYSAFF